MCFVAKSDGEPEARARVPRWRRPARMGWSEMVADGSHGKSRMRIAAIAACVLAFPLVVFLDFKFGNRDFGVIFLWALAAEAIVAALCLRGTARDLTVSACVFIVGLAAFETVAAAFEQAPRLVADHGMSEDRPFVGWGPRAPGRYRSVETAADGRVIYDVHYTIGDDLTRIVEAPSGAGGVAFFGDSFTFGEGLDDKDTLAQAYSDATAHAIPVVNLGYSGYSPAQSLIELQKGLHDDRLDKPRGFVLTTAVWHAERTSCRAAYSLRAPRFVWADGALAYAGACSGGATLQWYLFLEKFAVYRMFVQPRLQRPNRADLDTYLRIVDAFVATARTKYKTPTVILYLPTGPAYYAGTGLTDAEIVAGLKASGAMVLVDTLDTQPDPQRFQIPGDGHPTALANNLRAASIDRAIRETPAFAVTSGR